jgi:hypothetical protein
MLNVRQAWRRLDRLSGPDVTEQCGSDGWLSGWETILSLQETADSPIALAEPTGTSFNRETNRRIESTVSYSRLFDPAALLDPLAKQMSTARRRSTE